MRDGPPLAGTRIFNKDIQEVQDRKPEIILEILNILVSNLLIKDYRPV
jgi:hypothetical protein